VVTVQQPEAQRLTPVTQDRPDAPAVAEAGENVVPQSFPSLEVQRAPVWASGRRRAVIGSKDKAHLHVRGEAARPELLRELLGRSTARQVSRGKAQVAEVPRRQVSKDQHDILVGQHAEKLRLAIPSGRDVLYRSWRDRILQGVVIEMERLPGVADEKGRIQGVSRYGIVAAVPDIVEASSEPVVVARRQSVLVGWRVIEDGQEVSGDGARGETRSRINPSDE